MLVLVDSLLVTVRKIPKVHRTGPAAEVFRPEE